MINTITIEREYGSGGAAIAKKLAERLGWELWDERLTAEIARAMPCDKAEVAEHEERRDPLYYRLLKSFMRGTFEGNPNAARLRLVDADCIFAVTKRLVTKLGEQGRCVIVGRGGAYFLGPRRDAYHVFVYAPAEDKVRRLRRLGHSETEAARLIATVDDERAAFIKNYFNLEWPARSSYDLMINSRVGEDAVVDLILSGMAALGPAASGARGR